MSDLGKAKGRAELGMIRIRILEHRAKRLEGDIASLYLTENNAISALDDMKEERDIVKDAIVRTMYKYQFATRRLNSRWRWEEWKRRRRLKEAQTYLKGAKGTIKAIKARSPKGMQSELRNSERNLEMDADLAQEIIDILTGRDPQDLQHSQCYNRFLAYIRLFPIHKEPIRPLFMDGRGILKSIVSHCRYFGWNENRTARYITRHWTDLETVYLSKP